MSSSTVIACPSCGTKNRVPDAPIGVPRCASCKGALPWIVDAGAGEFDEDSLVALDDGGAWMSGHRPRV